MHHRNAGHERTSVSVARVHRPGVHRANGAFDRIDGQLARPREQPLEPKLKVGERLGAIVRVKRVLAIPLAEEHEPAGFGQGRGEDVAPAAGLSAGPSLKAFEQVCELPAASADREHFGNGDHAHQRQLTQTSAASRFRARANRLADAEAGYLGGYLSLELG
jgi:hypothetical protein